MSNYRRGSAITEILQAALLGVLQGLTEFLPISSTGHLVLVEWLLGVREESFGLTFDAAVHLGTLVAVLGAFRKEVTPLVRGFLTSIARRGMGDDPWAREAWLLATATVPAVVAGVLFEDIIGRTLRSPLVVGSMLVLFGILLLVAERVGAKRTDAQVSLRLALLIGFAQAIALVPGVSRSGITITVGMLGGLARPPAARFAFLLSAPIVAGAGGKQLVDVWRIGNLAGDGLVILVGLVSAAASGYLVIRFLLRFLADHPLDAFAYYRFGLAIVIFGLVVSGQSP